MEIYRNNSGRSDVISYEVGDDYIIVQFRDGGTYSYTYKSTGAEDVEHMKQLALEGEGLNTFINTDIRARYAEKLR